MSDLLSQIQFVVLDSPYESFFQPETQDLFSQALQLKLKSYQNVYASGVLPLDTYDFISTHHLIGREDEKGQLQPLMVFRTTSHDRCQRHLLTFPGVAVLRSSGAMEHAIVLERRLQEWTQQKLRVSYGSGWAIAPELRADRILRDALKDLMTALLVNHEQESCTDQLVACGAARVHTDEYFQNIGYRRMCENSVELPAFRQSSLIGVEAVLLETKQFNERALQLAKRYRSFWENRRELRAIQAHAEEFRKSA